MTGVEPERLRHDQIEAFILTARLDHWAHIHFLICAPKAAVAPVSNRNVNNAL